MSRVFFIKEFQLTHAYITKLSDMVLYFDNHDSLAD